MKPSNKLTNTLAFQRAVAQTERELKASVKGDEKVTRLAAEYLVIRQNAREAQQAGKQALKTKWIRAALDVLVELDRQTPPSRTVFENLTQTYGAAA